MEALLEKRYGSGGARRANVIEQICGGCFVPPPAGEVKDVNKEGMKFNIEKVLRRYRKDFHVGEETAKFHEEELKRYLFLCAKYPGKGFPMFKMLDDLWHTFIIHTKEYFAFCYELGVPYLHHTPSEEGEKVNLDVYSFFLQKYIEEFGDPQPEVWSPVATIVECGGGDCENNCVQCR